MANKKLEMLRRIKAGESFEDCSREDSYYIKELFEGKLVLGIDLTGMSGFGWHDVRLTLSGEEELERLQKMEYKEKEELIDKLLIFVYQLEKKENADLVFDFSENGNHSKLFLSKFPVLSYDGLCDVIQGCVYEDYFVDNCMKPFEKIRLTQTGRQRAKLVLAEKHGETQQTFGSTINIGQLHNTGNAQIGNGNVQNVTQVFGDIINRIDESDASEKEKAEAKGLLRQFLEHPLAGAVVGLGAEAVKTLCGV